MNPLRHRFFGVSIMYMRLRSSLFMLLFLLPGFALAAPNVALKDLDGKARNANEFIGKGKWTVVAFWAHDCTICRQEIHHMAFFHDAHRKKNAEVLGVSVDGYANKEKARTFVEEHALTFPNLIGDPAAVAQFGAGSLVGTPTYYIYAPDGTLAARQVGAVTQEQIEDFINTRTKAQ